MLLQQRWPWSGDHHTTVEKTTETLAIQCIGDFNPLNLKILLVILLTVCQMILIMLAWRIWYQIN